MLRCGGIELWRDRAVGRGAIRWWVMKTSGCGVDEGKGGGVEGAGGGVERADGRWATGPRWRGRCLFMSHDHDH